MLTKEFVKQMREAQAGLTPLEKKLLPQADRKGLFSEVIGREEHNRILGNLTAREGRRLSEVYKDLLPRLVDVCVARELQEEFYYALDEMNQFQMTTGWYRRSLRSESYAPFIDRSVELLWAYARLKFYGAELADVLTGRVDQKISEDARSASWSYAGMLAASIDRGNERTVQAVKDILFGENNTQMVSMSRELVRGIVMSKSEELYGALGDFLLAARLQEGARQAVCESMDEGRPQAFVHLFGVIEEHGLIRYSSVKRAVSTWIGIYDPRSIERIPDKLVQLMGQSLRDSTFREEQLASEDAIGICCALWAKGFYDVRDGVEAVLRLAREGTRHQVMTASYFLNSLQSRRIMRETAKAVIFAYPEDTALAACYFPYFLGDAPEQFSQLLDYHSTGCNVYWYSPGYDKGTAPAHITAEKLAMSAEEAKRAYAVLKGLLELVPKKGLDLNPCIFPWYRVKFGRSEIVYGMCLLAWALQENEYLDEACGLLPVIGQSRHLAARVLLHKPRTEARRKVLLESLHSPEDNTRKVAFRLVKDLKLTSEEYREIENNLRYKKGRAETLELLKKQEAGELRACIGRLLDEKRSEECHMGALELAKYLKEEKASEYAPLAGRLRAFAAPTEKERLLLAELTGEDKKAQDILDTPGYGLYDPDRAWAVPKVNADLSLAEKLFVYEEKDYVRILRRLDELIGEHKDEEYKDLNGDEQILGNGLYFRRGRTGDSRNNCPFQELWEDFYKEEIRTPELMLEVYLYHRCLEKRSDYGKHTELYGKVFGRYFKNLTMRFQYGTQVETVTGLLFAQYVPREMKACWGLAGTAKLFAVLEGSVRSYMEEAKGKPWRTKGKILRDRVGLPLFAELFSWLSFAEGEEWLWAFALRFRIRRERGSAAAGYYRVEPSELSDYVQCCMRGLWDKELFYKAILEFYDMGLLLDMVSGAMLRLVEPSARRYTGYGYAGANAASLWGEKGSREEQFGLEICGEVIPKILEVELKRGEAPTPFSRHVQRIHAVAGVKMLVRILTAIGKDTLERGYFGMNEKDRRKTLCGLLQRCYPAPGETAADLKDALKGTGITRKRLIETAMYARQWIPMLEENLGIPGFKSGCYYFMAHTSDWLGDEVMAMAARYTPLDREELRDGAFDIRWFFEAYEKLGEKDFQALYDAAKYSAAGANHARARKYADAALGKVSLSELQGAIDDKRNKDLLMSLALLPLSGERERREAELLERYQYILNYKKESRQFGAQRRASEARAADMALRNLSMNAGFSDVMRLTLRMETRLTEDYGSYFAWKAVEDGEESPQICVFVDETGQSTLKCQKDGKILKSVPAKYKKNPVAAEYQDICKKLKEQYRRARQMLEQAMEDRTAFEVWELVALMKNPVIRPMLASLVFRRMDEAGGNMGFLSSDGLRDWSGEVAALSPAEQVWIAHPCDFYRDGHWPEYQRVLFAEKIRQPFKQVFRELYVKLTDEQDKTESRLFSGYQIQPKKTMAVLRGRRWVADYESGLQKIYYKENIIACISALADWFSPGDIEAPTLESVIFYDRKDFREMKISEIPDILYSEVMRDVDLAVSTAYVGGVDPEASHSTVEMRRAVITCNLELLGIKNVRLEKNHAWIEGKLGRYMVHLGSGVIHQMGNAMLHVLPVHSQHRGRIFLPFVDEDPKTAEIFSKIVLLSEDAKIKDPAILEQIQK